MTCRYCHVEAEKCRCGAQAYLKSKGDGKPYRDAATAPHGQEPLSAHGPYWLPLESFSETAGEDYADRGGRLWARPIKKPVMLDQEEVSDAARWYKIAARYGDIHEKGRSYGIANPPSMPDPG